MTAGQKDAAEGAQRRGTFFFKEKALKASHEERPRDKLESVERGNI